MPDNLSLGKFAHSQLILKLPYPETKFTGKTVIVTGANSGLGLEAARHFVRLHASRVILAVRDTSKGEAALKTIEESTGRRGIIQRWQLDLASYASVESFATRINDTLDRLDIVAQNAGVYTLSGFSKSGQDEHHITVNVVSTMLLALLLLPKLRQTQASTGCEAVMTFTGSWMHTLVSKFPEQDAVNIFAALSDFRDGQKLANRYEVSKLLQLLHVRELAAQVTSSNQQDVIISTVNPGAVATNITREPGLLYRAMVRAAQVLTCRSADEGARTIVHAALGGRETHGMYLDDCRVGETSRFVESEKGRKVQKELWAELGRKLEAIHAGIMSYV